MGQEPETGFDDFMRGRAGALFRSAYLLTGDRHVAEDLLQDTLERVYRRWSRIATSPEAYARRALVNGAMNRWRWRRRRPEAPLSEAHDVADPDHAATVALRTVVRNALCELPARQRAVVVLRYFDDLSEAEVASLLSCSVGTVKSHASRGLARLRAVLSPAFDPPVSHSGRNL